MNPRPANCSSTMLCEVRCAWCGSHMGEQECDVPEGMTPVTHGICQPCYDKHIKPLEVKPDGPHG